jgi:hypothetical protein
MSDIYYNGAQAGLVFGIYEYLVILRVQEKSVNNLDGWLASNNFIMTKVIIPSNTGNSISKIAEFEQHHNSCLFLGNLEAACNLQILKEYKIVAILTVAGDVEVAPPAQIAHKVIHVEDNQFEQICKYFSEMN